MYLLVRAMLYMPLWRLMHRGYQVLLIIYLSFALCIYAATDLCVVTRTSTLQHLSNFSSPSMEQSYHAAPKPSGFILDAYGLKVSKLHVQKICASLMCLADVLANDKNRQSLVEFHSSSKY
ncbi:hypothetical protein BDQ12DRAFT_86051 [Crucibulum laeve]|uniref:Uncharacterized protein n=1 Tax=Crucibulum laeve TaxID=68775 RepID=A0A5C3M2E2_9AGAR|nr:hypothetical protein BDQ12DRAFT_86051 [Crucibulum laeve]